MCGRFTTPIDAGDLEARFGAQLLESDYLPRFNAAPTQMLPVVCSDRPKEIVLARWGFIPHWAKAGSDIKPQINARGETVASKPSFRHAFRGARCLVLAQSFFEWKRDGATKQPYRILLARDAPFAMAGIWSAREEDGARVVTFAIITTEANALVREIHDRMPVILPEEAERRWLDPGEEGNTLERLLVPFPERLLAAYPVSRAVNNPRNDTRDVLAPLSG